MPRCRVARSRDGMEPLCFPQRLHLSVSPPVVREAPCPHQQCARPPRSPHPHQHAVFVFLTPATLTGARWPLVAVSICSPGDRASTLPRCLWAGGMALGKRLFAPPAHFQSDRLGFFAIELWKFSPSPNVNPSPDAVCKYCLPFRTWTAFRLVGGLL